jgi:hypothetical protein
MSHTRKSSASLPVIVDKSHYLEGLTGIPLSGVRVSMKLVKVQRAQTSATGCQETCVRVVIP